MKEKSHTVREKFSAAGLVFAIMMAVVTVVMICAELGIGLSKIGAN